MKVHIWRKVLRFESVKNMQVVVITLGLFLKNQLCNFYLFCEFWMHEKKCSFTICRSPFALEIFEILSFNLN